MAAYRFNSRLSPAAHSMDGPIRGGLWRAYSRHTQHTQHTYNTYTQHLTTVYTYLTF